MKNETEKKAKALYNKFDAKDQAYPTSRCLPQPWDGGEEWCDEGTIGRKKAEIYYYFGEDVITDDEGNRTILAEDYSWDFDHVCGIVIADEVKYSLAVFGR